jgi:hypothetical protein
MASMPFKAQIVKFSINFTFLHSNTAPNTTSLVGVMAPCAKSTLMGLATFVATHLSCFTAPWFINECMTLESKRHNTPLVLTLNLNKIKLGPNMATLAFPTNPPYAQS